MTSLALTKLDVLSEFAELPVCVRYRLRDGSETEHFPAHQSDFHHAEPVWEVLPGWQQPLDDASSLDDLPTAAREYVEYVSRALDVPIELVGVGAARERVLAGRCRRSSPTRRAPGRRSSSRSRSSCRSSAAAGITIVVLRGAKNDPDEQRWRREAASANASDQESESRPG